MLNGVGCGGDLLPLHCVLLLVLICWYMLSWVLIGCSVVLGCLLCCGGLPLWLLWLL